MSNPKLLLPIRVPELGPSLGKLMSGIGRKEDTLQLDAIRYKLATRIVAMAGEARRLATNEERAAALAAVGRANWEHAWDETVKAVTEQLVFTVSRHLENEARAVRLTRRQRAKLAFSRQQQLALRARLACTGADLIPVLDQLEERAVFAMDATGLEREAVENWQNSLKHASRRLEASWLALEDVIEEEMKRARERADQISEWRKPLWPAVVTAVVVISIVGWIGLVLGGFFEAPSWMTHLWRMVFGE